jgi:hypothetical protein
MVFKVGKGGDDIGLGYNDKFGYIVGAHFLYLANCKMP